MARSRCPRRALVALLQLLMLMGVCLAWPAGDAVAGDQGPIEAECGYTLEDIMNRRARTYGLPY